ncbi:FAD dependent oxidoreductase/monooxygenase [Colletotrichum truncatum]|uniref:FAD dependent oxidoreductase/monooxygenase n=1 Tax=Colletotrichum truncatum TaxID=5467 RepID=A0ACC3Z5D2_COLTU
MSNFRVIIIGGGLSGPLLGNGLLKNGVDFVLYERDSEDSKYEGYQIRLGDGAMRGFSACLTQSHTEAILRKLGKSANSAQTAPSIFTSRFEQLVDFSKVPSYSKSSAINRVVLRDLLMEPIKASKRVRYQKEFSSYEIIHDKDGSEKVKVNFRDGSSDTCDVLIGTDGSRSKINRQIGLNNLVTLKSHWGFLVKGKLPYTRVLELPEHLRKGPIIVLSKRVSLYYALYLPEDFSGSRSFNDTKSVISYDESAASYYWGLNVPVEMIPDNKIENVKDRRQFCLDVIKDWAPEYHQMLSVGKGDEGASDMHVTMITASTEPSLKWREKVQKGAVAGEGHPRVWLAGDAIHAMQPNRGQGGNQSLSDCADLLPQLLNLHSLSKKTSRPPPNQAIITACAEYEAAMIPRAFNWVRKSGGSSYPVSKCVAVSICNCYFCAATYR